MKKFGIDVSFWQGNFDFKKAQSEGIEFAILRGAYARGKDKKFESYYSKCKALNIPVGVYHYSMAQSPDDARKEAEFLYNKVLKGKQFELPIYIDVEDKTQLVLSKRELTDVVKAWCEYLEARKFFVGIYASKWTFESELYDSELTRYSHWIAQWDKECTYKGRFGMWQYGGEKNVIRSNQICGLTVDQNFMYEDFPAVIKRNKLNGYGNPNEQTKPVTGASDGSQTVYKIGDKIKLKNGATYYDGQRIPQWVMNSVLYIRSKELTNGDYIVSVLNAGAITGKVNKKYFEKI